MKTSIITSSEDKDKKIYRQKTYYTLILEQDVMADNEEEAHKMLGDEGGIDYKEINSTVTHESVNVSTYFVDADYDHSEIVTCIGKVDEEGDVVDYYGE